MSDQKNIKDSFHLWITFNQKEAKKLANLFKKKDKDKKNGLLALKIVYDIFEHFGSKLSSMPCTVVSLLYFDTTLQL